MRKVPFAVFVLLATVSAGALARAEEAKPAPEKQPWLWLAEAEGQKIYLFGTIHLPHAKVRTLPAVVNQALAASDSVFVEIKPSELETPATQQRMLLPPGKKLADVVPADVLTRLRAHLGTKGIPPGVLDQYRPWAVAMTVPILEHMQLLALHPPMDKALYQTAEKAGQEVGALESVNDQFGIFEAMSEAAQAKHLGRTLDQMKEAAAAGRDLLMELIDAYANGDEAKVLALMKEADQGADEETLALSKRLIDDRNVTMTDRTLAEAKKRPGKTLFVAVGMAHHIGEKGIVKALEAKGFKVRRLKADETIAPKKREAAAPTRPAGK